MDQGFLPTSTISQILIPAAPAISSCHDTVAFAVQGVDKAADTNTSTIWCVDRKTAARLMTKGPNDSQPSWRPESKAVSFIRGAAGGDQVWLCEPDGPTQRLTQVPGHVVEHAWSPCGRFIALRYKALGRGSRRADETSAPTVLSNYGYQHDGDGRFDYPRVTLGLWDCQTSTFRQLTHQFDVHALSWSPDGGSLALAAVDMAGSDLTRPANLYVLDPHRPGAAPELIWTKAANITGVRWHPDCAHVLVVGSVDRPQSIDSLMLVPAANPALSVTDLTLPLDRNVMTGDTGYPGGVPVFSPDRSTIYFTARDKGCTVLMALRDGRFTQLYGGEGIVVTGFAQRESGELVLTVRTVSSFGELIEIDPDSKSTHHLFRPESPTLSRVREERWFTAHDGESIQGWLLSPAEPSLGSPPPLLVDIHGGPHSAWNGSADEIHLYHQDLAARGWRILLLNPRGSDGYGRRFSSAVNGGWGIEDHRDILGAVDELVARGDADPERLAITGYSYGGYLTCYITSRDRRFRAAVAGGVVTDLASWVGTADHGHHTCAHDLCGYPWDSPERFAAMSPSSRVQDVVTPTLILQGEDDLRTPLNQAMQWHTFLVGTGVASELVVYPQASHNFNYSGRPSQRIDYSRRLIDWLEQWVEPAASRPERRAGRAVAGAIESGRQE